MLTRLLAYYQGELNKQLAQDTESEKIYRRAKSLLGQDASPRDLVRDDVACAESLCNVLEIPVITGTYTLNYFLATSPLFEKVFNPVRGDIIISPTGTGNGQIIGHTGIVSDNGKIMSNNSNSGLWDEHLDISLWNWRYANLGGFPINYYRRKVL